MKRPESPEEILIWMDETIQYGWLDGEKKVHRDMTGFRRDYRIASFEECLKYRVGTCIEQVWMMHLLLDQLYLPNKMYCCRIFEPDDYGNLEEEEHMHCFVLYWKDGKVWQIEHPNQNRKGIYAFSDEVTAVRAIEDYYIALRGGKKSPTTEFTMVEQGLSFREFHQYINSLDGGKGRTR